MSITTDFFAHSDLDSKSDAYKVMEFLSSPETINKMIVVSDLGLPAMTAVVGKLEEDFGNSASFPLKRNTKDKNYTNHRHVGRMIKFIMEQVGYYPKKEGLNKSVKDPIPEFANSQYFGTSIVYEKTEDAPQYCIKKILYKKIED